MNTKLFLKSLILSCLFFVASLFGATLAEASPRLYFEPSSQEAKRDTDFQVKIQIDVESQSAFGADAVIVFPSGDITVKSVTNGGFFTDFSVAQSPGKLEIHGYFSTIFAGKSGSGAFATLVLSSNKDSGNGNISFTCTNSGVDTQVLNTVGLNILNCQNINNLTLSYVSSGSTGGPSNGPTNSCGGTCGSHYNCNSGLFCYNGFCRAPLCRDDSTCECKVTPSPSSRPISTRKPFAGSTPEIIVLSEYKAPTPHASLKPTTVPTPSTINEDDQKQGGIDYKRVGLIALSAAGIIFVIIAISKLFKKKNIPPMPNPPYPPSIPEPQNPPIGTI